ncbi:MAG TPA: UDP-N-acetylmuramoyl-tripeptide--D-alanyl-D-alanine ligase, partial [Acetobacteraceae bacterium]
RRPIPAAGGTAMLLDESYNASAVAVRAALAVLALQPAARRIAVLGDMLELGEAGPAEHEGLAPQVIANADLLFACGPLSRLLFDAVPERMRGAWAPDSAALAPLVTAALRHGDAILVKGSLGSRMRQVVLALEGQVA